MLFSMDTSISPMDKSMGCIFIHTYLIIWIHPFLFIIPFTPWIYTLFSHGYIHFFSSSHTHHGFIHGNQSMKNPSMKNPSMKNPSMKNQSMRINPCELIHEKLIHGNQSMKNQSMRINP
jgi:hypothetical protein